MDATISTSPLGAVQLIPIFTYMELLSGFLFNEHYLTELHQNQQIRIVNALYDYLEENRFNRSMSVKLIRSLLKGSDLYGENDYENLDEIFINTMFDYIITSLVFDKYGNIYGFLVDSIRKVESLNIYFVLNVIKERLKNEKFDNEYGTPSVLSELAVNRIYSEIILPMFPQPKTNLSLLSLDYMLAQVGSTYLRLGRINSTYYSYYQNSSFNTPSENLFDEYLIIGQVIICLLYHNKIDRMTLRVFALPALFFYIFTEDALKHETITNIISSPYHWKRAYSNFDEYLLTSNENIKRQLTNDNIYKLHTGFLRFQTRITMAKSIIASNCKFSSEKEKRNLTFTYLQQVKNFECHPGVNLPNINDLYKDQIRNLGELYADYDLELTEQCFNKFLIGDLRDVVVNLVLINDEVMNPLQHVSYDLLEVYHTVNMTSDYYALIRENYTLTLIKEADDSKFFKEKVGPPLDKHVQLSKRINLMFVNEGIKELSEALMKQKKEQFMYYLSVLDYNNNDHLWWKEFGLSLVSFYPCFSNSLNFFNFEENLYIRNNVNFLDTFKEDITSYITNFNTRSLASSYGTGIKTVFLKIFVLETINKLIETNNEFSFELQNEMDYNTVFEKFSLHLEEPKFESTSITQKGIELVAAVINTLKEDVNFNFTSVNNILNKMQYLKNNFVNAIGSLGGSRNLTLFVNTVNAFTGYGYPFKNILSHNKTVTATLRTGFELKDMIVITPVQNSSNKGIYNKLDNLTFQFETDSFIYEINNQLRKKSANVLFLGVWFNRNDEKCLNDDYLEKSKHSDNCLRHWRFIEKNNLLEKAIMSVQSKAFFTESKIITEEEIRNTLEKYTLPDDETFAMYFILKFLNDKHFETSDWSNICLIDNPELLNKLRFEMILENNNVTEHSGKFRIESIYNYRERLRIEEGTSMKNIVEDYNRQKAGFAVTFDDYYAIRNFVTSGYKRITQDTNEAKLMKLALYKLAVRQSDDLIQDYEWKLFRVESIPSDIANTELYVGKRIILQKFTLTSTSIQSATRFTGRPASGFRNVLYEMRFTEPYFRAKIETRVDYHEPIDEHSVILLPGCEFRFERVSIAPFGAVALARLSSLRGGGVGGDVASSPRDHGGEDKSAGGRVRQAAGGASGGEPTDVTEKKERPPASETVEPTAAFDVASLVLYGSRALPIRLKIYLDQLFNQLPHAQVTRLLATFGWTHEDYSRGYILQDSQNGPVLDRWSICSAEEEPLVLQQFLKFAETRPFVEQLLQAAGTPGSDAMSPSRRPSPPTMPLAHLPPPLHLLHCGLPPSSRLTHPLPPPLPPVSHHSMSPTVGHQKHYSTPTGNHGPTNTANSPPRNLESNSHLTSPLNRLQSMQPFDFRKLGTLGLPAFPPLPPPPEAMLHQSRKSRHQHSPQSPTQLSSASQLRHPVPVAPVSTSALTYGHSLAVAVSSGALPPSFPGHYPSLMSGKPSANSTGSGLSGSGMDTHSGGEKSSEFGSDDEEDDEENSGSALNLSRRDSVSKHANHRFSSLSIQASSLGRPSGMHAGRKPHSPGKRHQWGAAHNMPPNLGTPFINPTTGKKRVQCNVCLKTFCDKGALKIHFSAVHLREMHQCTVKGCSMMFSSRRSRNRHSANPNPKLHSPHLRRKISPHDGRSSMAHALVLPPQVGLPVPPSGLNHLSFGSFPLLTPPPDLRSPASLCGLDFKHLDPSSQNVRSYEEALQQRVSINASSSLAFSTTTTTSTMSKGSTSTISLSGVSPSSQTAGMMEDDDDDEEETDDGGIVVVAEDECNLPTRLSDDDQPADFSLAGRTKLSLGDKTDEEVVSNPESNEDNDSISRFDQHMFAINPHTINSSTFHSRGVRKRKSQHPTRCTIPAEVHSSSTDGDSSNDAVFQDQPEDMSMSRLEAEERKNSPSPRNPSESNSPKLSTGANRNRRETVSSEDNEQPQDEPRDLSSRASSVRSPKRQTTPEPKYSNTPDPEAASSPRASREMSEDRKEPEEKCINLEAVNKERRSDVIIREQEADDEEPMEIEEDEEVATTLRNQEGERPDDPPRAPSSIDSHPTTADDLSLDSSNALRQLESLSQGRMPYTGIPEEPSRSGRVSTSPVTLTMHQDTTLDNSSHGSHSSSGSPSPVAMDTDNSLITYARYENGGFVSTQEVPLDRENPRRCTACGKVFQNHFGVKTHYQNVHLKLMHRCSVDGCNAAFPSKRSRDRHSANLNLHRKLLSTSTSPPLNTNVPSSLSPRIDDTQINPLLHSEFLARLYADAGIGALGTFPLSGLSSAVDLAARIPPPHPLLLPPHLGFPGLSTFASHLAGLNGLTHQHLNQLNLTASPISSPTPDEQKHEAKCTIPGCNRVFGSRAVRDAHSRDPQAHRDLPILSNSGS